MVPVRGNDPLSEGSKPSVLPLNDTGMRATLLYVVSAHPSESRRTVTYDEGVDRIAVVTSTILDVSEEWS